MKFDKKFKSVLTTTLAVTLLLSSSSAVFAAGNTATINTEKVISKKITTQKNKFKDILNPYVKVVDNQYVLIIPKDKKLDIDPAELNKLKTQMAQSNQIIKNKNLKIDPVKMVAVSRMTDAQLIPKSNTGGISPSTISPLTATSDDGITEFDAYWWGFDLYLSGSMVKYLIQTETRAASTLIGMGVPEYWMARWIITKLITMYEGSIDYCGIIIEYDTTYDNPWAIYAQ